MFFRFRGHIHCLWMVGRRKHQKSERLSLARTRKKKSVFNFYCGLCQKDASSRHQGSSDLKRHEKSRDHQSLAQAMNSSGSLYAVGLALV